MYRVVGGDGGAVRGRRGDGGVVCVGGGDREWWCVGRERDVDVVRGRRGDGGTVRGRGWGWWYSEG